MFEAEAYKNILENDDVLLVAAAGNGGNTGFSYPASYTSVMSVGALDSNENIASFSQRNEQVDIAGPGVGTISTVPGNGYSSFSGTSSKFQRHPHYSEWRDRLSQRLMYDGQSRSHNMSLLLFVSSGDSARFWGCSLGLVTFPGFEGAADPPGHGRLRQRSWDKWL